MHIPKLAVCTLAVMATQDLGQNASAKPLPASESTPATSLVTVKSSPVKSASIAQSLATAAISAPIANVQVEFNQIEFSHPPASSQATSQNASQTAPQIQPSPAVAQTTTIDQIENNPPEENPSDTPPGNSSESAPSGETTEPNNPDRPSQTTPLPGSGQYLQDENLQDEPPAPVPSSVPVSPASPTPTLPTAPSNPSAAPVVSPIPSSSGLQTAPIAPVVQIGNVILPHRGALPASFTFPIRIRVTVDPSVTTNTPITNSARNLASWEERVRACLDEKPQIFAVSTDGTLAPILFDGQQGSILRNANGRMVCATLG